MKTPRLRRAMLARLAFGAAAAALALLPLGGPLSATVPAAGLERALAAQRALIAERPGDARLHEDYGSLLSLAEDLEAAELAYREAIHLDPSSASAHFQLGSVLERRGEDRKALKEYKAAIELDEEFAWAHYEAGTIWADWGLDRLARNAFARALALDPTLADPKVNPHILENRHATSAMILAYRKYQPEIAAPRTFHEPARIAALILERPANGDALAGGTSGAAGDATATTGASGFARIESSGVERPVEEPQAEPEASAGDEPEARVLTSKDLEPGSATGQVVGGAVAGGSRARPGGVDSAAERARARAAARQASRPAKDTGGGMSTPIQPGQGGVGIGGVGGGGTPFTPGLDSTGRLEIRLDDAAG